MPTDYQEILVVSERDTVVETVSVPELIESSSVEVIVDVLGAEIVSETVAESESIESFSIEIIAEVLPADVIVETVLAPELIIELMVGPPGPPQASEEDMTYAKRVDFITDDLLYRGEAAVGTLESQPLWRIRRITFIGDDVVEVWAGGNANFTNTWDDRVALEYT